MQGLGITRRDHLSVADDDGHDRHTRRHGQPEWPLLERAHRSGVEPGALRGDHHRQTLAGEFLGFLERLDRLLGVFAVDENGIGQLAHRSHDRIACQLLLAHAGPVVLQHRRDDYRIEVVTVVEDEHRRTLFGEVLLTDDVEVHAVDGQ